MPARRIAETIVTLATFAILVSCSEPSTENAKKEYDTPRDLCGTSVDRDLLSDFLPSGNSVEVRKRKSSPLRTQCQVNVDGKRALLSTREWRDDVENIASVAKDYPETDSAVLKNDRDPLYTDTGAVQLARSCFNSDHPGQRMYTAMQVYASVEGGAPAMKKLIQSYTKAVEHSKECQQGEK